MATQLLRPNADITFDSANTTTNPASHPTIWDLLNDAVTQPAAPSTASGFINDGASSSTNEVALETFSLAGGIVTQVIGWIYLTGSGGAFTVTTSLWANGVQLASAVITPAGSPGWQSVTYTGALTQSDIDDLRIRMLFANTIANSTVYETYAEVTYTPATSTISGATLSMMGVG